ncbi:BQ2448_5671 [Microbotryum intermedium]|uniref:BQ2448_5671 protein n=1 Tax=Microbotryum intermedium TaxID=269621 RepID=A0A238F1Y5_9BASI|nr:BQ2448_5671 [Microbotryum intermedium]
MSQPRRRYPTSYPTRPTSQAFDLRDLESFLRTRTTRRQWIIAVVTSFFVIALHRSGSSTRRHHRAIKYDRDRGADRPTFAALPELSYRRRLWPPDLNNPICQPKIYVYDLPPELVLPEATVSQCRWSAYNSELALHSLLASSDAPPYPRSLLTTDPASADLFLIPMFPACYLFNCWVKAGWIKTERCDVDESYIQPIMDYVSNSSETHKWWQRHGGEDHLILHPMDHVDGYYTEKSRAAMNSSSYLVTVGDLRPPPYSKHFRRYKDLVIPSSTHLLNSYYLNPMDYLDASGNLLSTPRGAVDPKKPTAPATRAEIFVSAAPASVPGFISRFFSSLSSSSRNQAKIAEFSRSHRPTTAIFRGGLGEAKDGESYALGIRSLFFPSNGDAMTPPFSSSIHPGFSSLPDYDLALRSENHDYALALSKAKFGLAPPGYTLDTTRIYEYLAFGVVPVFIGTGRIAGQVLPFENDFDWSSFSIEIPRDQAHRVPEILQAVLDDGERYENLREKVWQVGRLLVLEQGQGNVWKWLARDLCRLRRIGTGAGPEIANN